MFRRHTLARTLVVAALVLPLSYTEVVDAASARCTKAGTVRTVNGTKQVCTRVGKTLTWKNAPIPLTVNTGVKCTRVGSKRTVSGRSQECKKSGSKMFWFTTANTSTGTTMVGPTTTLGPTGTSAPSTTAAPPTTTRPAVPAPPSLSHSPIDSAGLNCDSGLPMVTARYYCFSSFADRVLESPGRLKWLPHYTYRLRPNAKIYAAMDGTIKRIITQEPDDLEFWLDNGDDVWMLVYDHVATMRVAEGARVKAGDWIANSLNEVTHRFEFQVNKDTRRIDNTSWHICPRTLGTASFNSFHDGVLASNNARATDGGFTSVCMAETVDPENLYAP